MGEGRDGGEIEKLLDEKEIVIEKYKYTIDKSNEEIEKYK